MDTSNIKIISTNRSAYHDYEIIDKLQVGINLVGSEVKTCRSLFNKDKTIKKGSVQLKGGYVDINNKLQMTLIGVNISCYNNASDYFNHNPIRERKLLAHKKEILKLYQQIQQKGLTIIPLQIYFLKNKIKLDIGLGRGKHNYDKREDLKNKQLKIELNRNIKY